jgi:hypothetical protein
VNIHSHLWGAAGYLLLLPLHFSTHITGVDLALAHLPVWSRSTFHLPATATFKSCNTSIPQQVDALAPRPQTLVDTLALSVFLCSAVGCLTLSGYFHLVQCTSKERCDSAHRGDYVSRLVREPRRSDELIAYVSSDRYRHPDRWFILAVALLWYAAQGPSSTYTGQLIPFCAGFRNDPVFQVGYIALITSLGICEFNKRSVDSVPPTDMIRSSCAQTQHT